MTALQDLRDAGAGIRDNDAGQNHGGLHHTSNTLDMPQKVTMAREKVISGSGIEITAGQKMVSAMSGSLLTSLLVTPLDVVRVRLQSQQQPSRLSSIRSVSASSPLSFSSLPPSLGVTSCCREVFFETSPNEFCLVGPKMEFGQECAVEETQRRTINSTVDGLRKIARNEGVTTLWRGLSPTLVMTVPANIIYFTGYDWLRFNKRSPIHKLLSDNYAPLVAGSTARILAATVVSPIEMFKIRMQASKSVGVSHFSETVKSLSAMVASHGYTSLWRGLGLTLWRDVPFSGIYWWGYESIRGAITEFREKHRDHSLNDEIIERSRSRPHNYEQHSTTFVDSFLAGATSGAVASVLTTPFDVGKTRQQVYKDSSVCGSGSTKAGAPEERSMPRFLWHMFRTEGLSGLWKGGTARTLKVAPACAIMISSYEVGKRAFRGVNERAERT